MQAKLAGTLVLFLADMSADVQVVYLDVQGTITMGDRARLYLKLRGRKINQGGQLPRIVKSSLSKTTPWPLRHAARGSSLAPHNALIAYQTNV
jgi:hypothetical protein